MVELNAAALRASMWLLVREEGLSVCVCGGGSSALNKLPLASSALNKLPLHGAPACLMPGRDSRLVQHIWTAVFTQESVQAKCPYYRLDSD